MNPWKLIGLLILPIRLMQGWIFWAGGSRRFIYDPSKLDPNAPEWLGNKLQSAMPGALFGTSHLIQFLLQHSHLLLFSLVFFSLLELLSGLGLMLGLMTRLCAFITVMLSISLMIIFGWQGSTCMDEWTMASANIAMGMTLILTGAASYSIDSWLMKKYPTLVQNKKWIVLASGEILLSRIKVVALVLTSVLMLFALGTYNYYRGAILSPYHAGPVSPTTHHLQLSKGKLSATGDLSFMLYVDAGTPAVPDYIIRIELLDRANKVIESWQAKELNQLSTKQIQNMLPYNKISVGPNGLVAPVGAQAMIILPSRNESLRLGGEYQLKVYSINGDTWSLLITAESASTSGFA